MVIHQGDIRAFEIGGPNAAGIGGVKSVGEA
jgi:hypothetical protein